MIKNTIELFRYYLIEHDVPFIETEHMGGIKWTFPFTDGDVICCEGSYYNESCVESIGMPWDEDDVTVLSPRDMAALLGNFDHWDEIAVDRVEYSFDDLIASLRKLTERMGW